MGLEKYNSLSPETVNLADRYSMTINPHNSLQSFEAPNQLQRFHAFRYDMIRILRRILDPFCTYRFSIEVSKLGRLHLHGWVQFKDILGFYLMATPSLIDICTFELDLITDFLIWAAYCDKSRHIFEPLSTIIENNTNLPKKPDRDPFDLNSKFKKSPLLD